MQPNIKYTIYKTKRKSLLLKLKNDGSLALYCPKGYPKKKALDFLYANCEKLLRLSEERRKKRLLTLFGGDPKSPTLMYLGHRYPVSFITSAVTSRKRLTFDGSVFSAPAGSFPDTLFALYKDFLRAEAKRILPNMVKLRAAENGFSYGRIAIKDISSRFGSCSEKKNLNFSLSLPAFCEDFIDFIVCHELAHTVQLNHSRDFHLLLDRICPKARRVDAEYKKIYSELSHCICS